MCQRADWQVEEDGSQPASTPHTFRSHLMQAYMRSVIHTLNFLSLTGKPAYREGICDCADEYSVFKWCMGYSMPLPTYSLPLHIHSFEEASWVLILCVWERERARAKFLPVHSPHAVQDSLLHANEDSYFQPLFSSLSSQSLLIYYVIMSYYMNCSSPETSLAPGVHVVVLGLPDYRFACSHPSLSVTVTGLFISLC